MSDLRTVTAEIAAGLALALTVGGVSFTYAVNEDLAVLEAMQPAHDATVTEVVDLKVEQAYLRGKLEAMHQDIRDIKESIRE